MFCLSVLERLLNVSDIDSYLDQEVLYLRTLSGAVFRFTELMAERSHLLLEVLNFEFQGSLLSFESFHTTKGFSHAVDGVHYHETIKVLRGIFNPFDKCRIHLVVKGFGRVSFKLFPLLLERLLVV